MNRNLYKRKSRQNTVFPFFSKVALLVAVAFILSQIFFPGSLGHLTKAFAGPLLKAHGFFLSAGSAPLSFFKSKTALLTENESLRAEIENMRPLALENKMLRGENETLLSLLSYRRFTSSFLAPVLKRPPATLYDTLLIDVGDKRISLGNRVIADGSRALGTIEAREGRVATVRLFSAPGVETEIFLGTSTATISARGLGGGNFSARIPRELEVKQGDILSLPGLPTLVFSEVSEVISRSADPFAEIRFQSPVNFNGLRFVEVITDDAETPLPPAHASEDKETEDNEDLNQESL